MPWTHPKVGTNTLVQRLVFVSFGYKIYNIKRDPISFAELCEAGLHSVWDPSPSQEAMYSHVHAKSN